MEQKDLFEILKYTVPSLISFLAAYFILKNYLDFNLRKQMVDLKMNFQKDVLPVRLQAFERMVIFLDRINVANLCTRIPTQMLSSKEYQLVLINEVKSEFEHNVSQQLFMSRNAWNAITMVKDDLLKNINLLGATLGENSTARDLSKALLGHYLQQDGAAPSQNAIDILKSEVQALF